MLDEDTATPWETFWVQRQTTTKAKAETTLAENPPSNPRDVGSILGQGTKIPHAMGQLSPHQNYRATCHN